MKKRSYTPPPEAWPYLPLNYCELSPRERARALQIAGREMADEVFKSQFAAINEKTAPTT